MGNAKYVVVDTGSACAAIVFGETMTHSEIAGSNTVISAGFVTIAANKNGTVSVSVYGESISLRKKPQEGDERRIKEALGLIDMFGDDYRSF